MAAAAAANVETAKETEGATDKSTIASTSELTAQTSADTTGVAANRAELASLRAKAAGGAKLSAKMKKRLAHLETEEITWGDAEASGNASAPAAEIPASGKGTKGRKKKSDEKLLADIANASTPPVKSQLDAETALPTASHASTPAASPPPSPERYSAVLVAHVDVLSPNEEVLKRGDEILEVAGVDVRGSHRLAVDLFRKHAVAHPYQPLLLTIMRRELAAALPRPAMCGCTPTP